MQETSKVRAQGLEGQVTDVLVEEINEHDPNLLTGRMSNNLLVHFPADPALIGKIVSVRLAECKGFYYLGVLQNN